MKGNDILMKYDLDQMILEAYQFSASDLFVKADGVPSIRQHGKIAQLAGYEKMTAEEVRDLVYSKMNPRQQAAFASNCVSE